MENRCRDPESDPSTTEFRCLVNVLNYCTLILTENSLTKIFFPAYNKPNAEKLRFGRRGAMERYIFAFSSVTIAIKAQAVLRRKGIPAEVIRTPKSLAVGCGYSVSSAADPGVISELLEAEGITPRAIGKPR